jgi:hypothetical protein
MTKLEELEAAAEAAWSDASAASCDPMALLLLLLPLFIGFTMTR